VAVFCLTLVTLTISQLVHITLSLPCGEQKRHNEEAVKYWEIIADNLKKRGWSLGWVSALDCERRTIWIVDAHRDDGKRYVVRADEKLTAFLELELAIRAASDSAKISLLGTGSDLG
jgi:hypothetical protein